MPTCLLLFLRKITGFMAWGGWHLLSEDQRGCIIPLIFMILLLRGIPTPNPPHLYDGHPPPRHPPPSPPSPLATPIATPALRKSPRPRQCWPLIGQRSVYKPCPGIAKALGDHLRDSSHLRGTERELISQNREKSAVGA
jgi:hypothetical protein